MYCKIKKLTLNNFFFTIDNIVSFIVMIKTFLNSNVEGCSVDEGVVKMKV